MSVSPTIWSYKPEQFVQALSDIDLEAGRSWWQPASVRYRTWETPNFWQTTCPGLTLLSEADPEILWRESKD